MNRQTLPEDLNPHQLPNHVAVIMDGNGRWAHQRGLPRIAGHRQGARMLKELLRCCKDWGISTLTVYAFSTENWQRPLAEVEFLMRLFERLLQQEIAEMQREGVRIQFIGDLLALPETLQRQIAIAETATQDNHAVQLNVAVNYGSRAELTQACRQLAQQAVNGQLSPEDISEDHISQHLYTQGQSSPDLLIRTSGECRLSNYLLWQLAYTEFYFTDTLWPDFNRTAFHKALQQFQKRDRRYGSVKASQTA